MSDNRNFDLDNSRNESRTREERELNPSRVRPEESRYERPVSSDEDRTKKRKKSAAAIQAAAIESSGLVGSRVTGSNKDDIAGVADIDKNLKR